MKTYTVTIAVEVEAWSEAEAIREARRIIPNADAPLFDVKENTENK